jgi:hypothetical protein
MISNENLLNEISIIQQKSINGINYDTLKKEHSKFYEFHPKLFDHVLDKNFNIGILEFMLSCKNKLNDKNVNDIDKEVVQKLNDMYLPKDLKIPS